MSSIERGEIFGIEASASHLDLSRAAAQMNGDETVAMDPGVPMDDFVFIDQETLIYASDSSPSSGVVPRVSPEPKEAPREARPATLFVPPVMIEYKEGVDIITCSPLLSTPTVSVTPERVKMMEYRLDLMQETLLNHTNMLESMREMLEQFYRE